jgi:hypothetical protein
VSAFAIPDFVGFYRWHVPDPIVFREDLRVTIQQIGAATFAKGKDAEADAFFAANPPAGIGILRDVLPGTGQFAIFERVDDYCAAAFTYCRDAQAVARVDPRAVTGDIARRSYESAGDLESFLGT